MTDLTTIATSIVASELHVIQGHPENPQRFKYFDTLSDAPFSSQLHFLEPQPASMDRIIAIHPQNYLSAIEQASAKGPGFVDYGDTYVTPASYQAAQMAAGAAIEVVQAVAKGDASRGFALIRPPGHHATFTRAMGFCLLNNIAIAARFVQSIGLERVMIVDFDVHHGNGTQDIFERDPTILYLSTHQAGIYPGTGYLNETGIEEGTGTIVNIPLPPRAGDQAFRAIAEQVISPVAARFKPDILLVSAGFDAHWNDPLASLQLSTQGYFSLSKALNEIADSVCSGRVVYLLEGGYDPHALVENVIAVFHAMAGSHSIEDHLGPAPFAEPCIDELLTQARSLHNLPKKA